MMMKMTKTKVRALARVGQAVIRQAQNAIDVIPPAPAALDAFPPEPDVIGAIRLGRNVVAAIVSEQNASVREYEPDCTAAVQPMRSSYPLHARSFRDYVTTIISYAVFCLKKKSNTVTHVPVCQRRSAIVRTQRSPIVPLSGGKARILSLPDHDERIQRNSAPRVLRIRRGRARCPHRAGSCRRGMVGAPDDERLTSTNRRFNTGRRERRMWRNSWKLLRLNMRKPSVGWNTRARNAVV